MLTHRISLKQLHVFSVITQHDSLTEAANTLCLSKAAVSMALRELEIQIGHVLFDRVNHRLILNQEGRKLLPLADELLHRAQDIAQIFHDKQSLQGDLKIGASDTLGNQVLPFLLSDFRRATGHESQSLLISNSTQICQMLHDYELDLAFIEGKAQQASLKAIPWQEDDMCVICAPDTPQHTPHDRPSQIHQLEATSWF